MKFSLRKLRKLFCVMACLCIGTVSAQAAQHYITGQQSMTIGLPGGLAALCDLSGSVYTADPYGIGESFALLVVFDTGASGCMLSQTDAGPDGLNIPLTGEIYGDIGIGGTENFYVSQSTGLMLAPIEIMTQGGGSSSYDPSEDISHYSYFGDYNFQIRQSDPLLLGQPANINIVGTPVLNNYVMHVTPNSSGYTTIVPTIDYVNAELLSEVPANLPDTGVYKIGLAYQNYIEGDPPVTTSTNPTIENITIALGEEDYTSTWLFDTGGSVSIIGRDMATSLGIDLENDPYVESVSVTGVGGENRLLFGYQVDSMTVPLTNGDELIFEDIVLFVPEDGALPADLTGIFGMNFINQSLSNSNIASMTYSPFSDWYVDPFNSELVLVLDTSTVPEPGTFILLAVGGLFFMVVRVVRRRR